jgi:hypothetical protein
MSEGQDREGLRDVDLRVLALCLVGDRSHAVEVYLEGLDHCENNGEVLGLVVGELHARLVVGGSLWSHVDDD